MCGYEKTMYIVNKFNFLRDGRGFEKCRLRFIYIH